VVKLVKNEGIMEEMKEIGFVFELEEVMKVLEEEKKEIRRKRNVIKKM
jgi:hypothetical protein